MLTSGLSPSTVLRAHRVLSRALKVAMQRGKVARNVCTLLDPPAARPVETVGALTADEARRVLRTAKGERNGARWTVALALALRWRDVDLERGSLTVQRGVHRVAGQGLVYEEPKSQRSRRTLALPAPLVEDLRAHRAAQLEERMAAANVWEDNGLLFAQPNGRPIDRRPTGGLGGRC
jgi:integrase